MIRLAGTSLDLLFGVLVPTLLDMLLTLLFKSVVNSRASDEYSYSGCKLYSSYARLEFSPLAIH